MLEACCNMKENENTRGREGSGGESNTPAVTSDLVQSSNSKGVKELAAVKERS